ncbi:MAG: hypothetical protein ABI702_00500 [Burkholderiales bacterium]
MRIALAWAAVLTLHVALIVSLGGSRSRTDSTAAPQRVTLRLIALTPSPPTPVPVPLASPSLARPSSTARPRKPTVTAPPEAATAVVTAAQPITPPASANEPLPSLLDTEATRRAIRASARTRSLGEQLAESREEPARASPNERLSDGIRSAGRGDCMHGEFAGAGMGLLSLPFLAAAAVGGKCTK